MAQAALVCMGFFSSQLDIVSRGAAFRVDGLSHE